MHEQTIKFQDVLKHLKNTPNIIFSTHFNNRCTERDLLDINILDALESGTVIEYVARYNQGEKFLIYCSQNNKVFHVSAVYNHGTLLLKTIYIPATPYPFKSDLMTRVDRL